MEMWDVADALVKAVEPTLKGHWVRLPDDLIPPCDYFYICVDALQAAVECDAVIDADLLDIADTVMRQELYVSQGMRYAEGLISILRKRLEATAVEQQA
ncbi:MAG: hypothetical protein Q4G30_07565 [Actinomycetaceae bacterium]|nr:hypothetical protein [Actinomycetaceae bacterium]